MRLLLAACLMLTLAACAAVPADRLGTPPRAGLTEADKAAELPLRVYDPWEGWNRGVYRFNALFDRYAFLPVVRAYRRVTPDFAERRVTDFFSNLGEFRNILNSGLQLRRQSTGTGIARLFVNSTLGVAGLFDVATPFGIAERREDFGQTLGRWASPPGPYMVIPVLGPSSARDFGGFLVDTTLATTVPPEVLVRDLVFADPAVYFLYAVDMRKQIDFTYTGSGSPFEYDYVRFLYIKSRELEIAN